MSQPQPPAPSGPPPGQGPPPGYAPHATQGPPPGQGAPPPAGFGQPGHGPPDGFSAQPGAPEPTRSRPPGLVIVAQVLLFVVGALCLFGGINTLVADANTPDPDEVLVATTDYNVTFAWSLVVIGVVFVVTALLLFVRRYRRSGAPSA